MRMRSVLLIVSVVAITASTIQVLAQGPQQGARREREVTFERAVAGPQIEMMQGARMGGEDYVFIASEMSFDNKLVKGAPYSAVAITEHIQTLGDGNRIVNKNSASIYRDSEGRTRREQVLTKIGPYASAGDSPQTIFINDPVAQVNYILEPNSRTARKMSSQRVEVRSSVVEEKLREAVVEARKGGAPPPEALDKMKVEMAAAGGVMIAVKPGEGLGRAKPNKESLGKQIIEGVEAEGTRITFTIAAGEIGNEQPINVVSERWYSADLQTLVMSKHSDPRGGETIYRLTNINRSEPAHSLFEVPADYTVKEAGVGGGMKFRIEKELERTKKDEK